MPAGDRGDRGLGCRKGKMAEGADRWGEVAAKAPADAFGQNRGKQPVLKREVDLLIRRRAAGLHGPRLP